MADEKAETPAEAPPEAEVASTTAQINTETQPKADSISWQASEYIHHEKDWMWYGLFALVLFIVMALMYLIVKDILSIVVIALMGVAVVVFANRKPRVLDYTINNGGVQVADKFYPYESFRGFTVVTDGSVDSIVLEPLQKLRPPISVYFEPKDENTIINILSNYLPVTDKEPDVIDRFARRIRF